jgi:hypothetical protein
LPNFPEITALTFTNILSVKAFAKKKRSAQIAIDLVREKLTEDKTDQKAYAIEMIFTTNIVPSAVKSAKERHYADSLSVRCGGRKANIFDDDEAAPLKDQSTGKKEVAGDLALWLAKEKIVVNGETFGWSDEGIIFW